MKIENFENNVKTAKNVYCVAVVNVIDKPDYFTNKKEAIVEAKKQANSGSEVHVDLLVWDDADSEYKSHVEATTELIAMFN